MQKHNDLFQVLVLKQCNVCQFTQNVTSVTFKNHTKLFQPLWNDPLVCACPLLKRLSAEGTRVKDVLSEESATLCHRGDVKSFMYFESCLYTKLYKGLFKQGIIQAAETKIHLKYRVCMSFTHFHTPILIPSKWYQKVNLMCIFLGNQIPSACNFPQNK